MNLNLTIKDVLYLRTLLIERRENNNVELGWLNLQTDNNKENKVRYYLLQDENKKIEEILDVFKI